MRNDDIPTFGTRVYGVAYSPRPGGYAVIIDDGCLACVRTPKGLFLPGGATEMDETGDQAAIRETLEETGLHIRVARYLGRADELVYKRSAGKYFRKECDFYLAHIITRGGTAVEDDHTLEWIILEEAKNSLSHGSQAWALGNISLDAG